MKPFPFAPFTRAMGEVYSSRAEFLKDSSPFRRRGTSTADRVWTRTEGTPAALIADLTGLHRRTIHRWVHEGLNAHQADELATAIGMHPSEVWPEWFGPVETVA